MALQSMGRQRGDPMAVGGGNGGGGGGGVSSSSIALLQERFRQLEKMRERREEMELLKLFSDTETISQTKRYERAGNMLLHPEMISHQPTPTTTTTTKRTCIQDSLSLGLDIYGKKTEQQQSKAPPYRDFWSMDSVTVSTSRAYDKHEVDTSLHL